MEEARNECNVEKLENNPNSSKAEVCNDLQKFGNATCREMKKPEILKRRRVFSGMIESGMQEQAASVGMKDWPYVFRPSSFFWECPSVLLFIVDMGRLAMVNKAMNIAFRTSNVIWFQVFSNIVRSVNENTNSECLSLFMDKEENTIYKMKKRKCCFPFAVYRPLKDEVFAQYVQKWYDFLNENFNGSMYKCMSQVGLAIRKEKWRKLVKKQKNAYKHILYRDCKAWVAELVLSVVKLFVDSTYLLSNGRPFCDDIQIFYFHSVFSFHYIEANCTKKSVTHMAKLYINAGGIIECSMSSKETAAKISEQFFFNWDSLVCSSLCNHCKPVVDEVIKKVQEYVRKPLERDEFTRNALIPLILTHMEKFPDSYCGKLPRFEDIV